MPSPGIGTGTIQGMGVGVGVWIQTGVSVKGRVGVRDGVCVGMGIVGATVGVQVSTGNAEGAGEEVLDTVAAPNGWQALSRISRIVSRSKKEIFIKSLHHAVNLKRLFFYLNEEFCKNFFIIRLLCYFI